MESFSETDDEQEGLANSPNENLQVINPGWCSVNLNNVIEKRTRGKEFCKDKTCKCNENDGVAKVPAIAMAAYVQEPMNFEEAMKSPNRTVGCKRNTNR